MPRRARALALVPPAASVPSVALHRRRQQVVVRAAGARTDLTVLEADGRLHNATLPGLGFRAEADTLPALGAAAFESDEATPISCVRTKVSPCGLILPPPMPDHRSRPVTLLDDVHAQLSREYLAEAERLLASGIFDAE
jgi:hypothetical protein